MTWLNKILREPRGPRTSDAVLEALCAGLPLGDALALRGERAGILEHEAGMPRAEAERRAGLVPSPAAGRVA